MADQMPLLAIPSSQATSVCVRRQLWATASGEPTSSANQGPALWCAQQAVIKRSETEAVLSSPRFVWLRVSNIWERLPSFFFSPSSSCFLSFLEGLIIFQKRKTLIKYRSLLSFMFTQYCITLYAQAGAKKGQLPKALKFRGPKCSKNIHA